MSGRHLAMAILVAGIWGFNFVVIRAGLHDVPPVLLSCLRFVLTAIPAAFLPRPFGWRRLVMIGLFMFAGQYALLFSAMAYGLPPGLASVVIQIQAFFTVLIAAAVLRERPTGLQVAAGAVAALGLVLIAGSLGGDATALGFALCVASGLSWSVGNVALRGAGRYDPLAMVAWASLVPPLPLAALSLALEGPARIAAALSHPTLVGVACLLFIAGVSTLVGFGIWGRLMQSYPVAMVVPFALLVPVFGAVFAWALVGERFGPTRMLGMVLLQAALALTVLGGAWLARSRRPA